MTDATPDRTVRSIEARGARAATLIVHLDDGETLELPSAVAGEVRVGDVLDAAALAALERATARWNAREAALRLLSHRARSRRELEDRLRRRDVPDELIAETVDRLRDEGYVDDARFAESFARDRIRFRPRGRRRILAELRDKGVPAARANPAVDAALEDESTTELELARTAALQWARRAPDDDRRALCDDDAEREVRERVRRRFYGYMARRGFTPDHVRSALEAICS